MRLKAAGLKPTYNPFHQDDTAANPAKQHGSFSTEEDGGTEPDHDDESSEALPWGHLKCREARGNLLRLGLSAVSKHEWELACTIMASAWIAGELDLGVAFWPEEDELALGDAIRRAWQMVIDDVENLDIEGKSLELVVARKASIFYQNRVGLANQF